MGDPTDPTQPIPSDAGMLDVAGIKPDPLKGAKDFFRTLWTYLEAKANEKGTRDAVVDELVAALDAAVPAAAPILADLEPFIKQLAETGAK